jgi:hypothetical protein
VLERSGVLRPYIKDKLSGKRKVRIPGDKFAHYNEEGKFDKAYQRTYGTVVAGSAEEKELKNIHGFYSTRTDTIHLRPKANVGDALHESIHKFSSNFLAAFGKFLNEGVTQFFTDLVLEEQGLPKGKSDYPKQLECAHKLVDRSSRDLVGKAYFMGDIGPLINSVARGLKIRAEEVMKLGKDGALCDRL